MGGGVGPLDIVSWAGGREWRGKFEGFLGWEWGWRLGVIARATEGGDYACGPAEEGAVWIFLLMVEACGW